MRLSVEYTTAVLEVVKAFDAEARVFLFGSRLDEAKRGGDLDLIIESRVIDFGKKLDLLSELKRHLGDQKIDIILTSNLLQDQDPFIAMIRGSAVAL